MRGEKGERRDGGWGWGCIVVITGVVILFAMNGCWNQILIEKPIVTVSILPQKFWVEQIAGDRFTVQVMVPPGVDYHTWEPSPKDMKNLSASSLYFSMGTLDFERAYLSRFRSANPRMVVVGPPGDLDLISDDHLHGGTDPHFWLSCAEVRKVIAPMVQAIVQADPAHGDTYQQNYARFLREIDTLETYLSGQLRPLKDRTVIIYHPALAYLARDYGFHQVSIEEEGKNPSALHMKEIVDLARQEQISTILVQRQIDQEMAAGIADEIGGQVEVIDPLAYSWMDNLREIARILNRIHPL
ncbi:MAG: zinc ABC transporter substrate-binding protein [Bacteroidales bacterium]|nr:zinc ABC transporter substrate-binding protein [Bacteroidales bacterium]